MTTSAGLPSQRIGQLAALAALAAGLLATACSDEAGPPLPPDPPTVEIEIVEHDLVYERPVPAGRVVFRVVNAGERVHRLALVPLPDDVPPIQEQLEGDTRRHVQQLARIGDLQPGETDSFAVDLAEGQRYALVDYSQAPDGTMHARLGVAGEFHAGG